MAMVIGLAGCALAQDSASGSDDPAAADFDQPEVTRLAPADYPACDPQAYCLTSGNISGTAYCSSGNGHLYCCPRGYSAAGGSCLPNCGNHLSCGWSGEYGTTVCSQSYSGNGNMTPIYCCAYGKTYTDGGCI